MLTQFCLTARPASDRNLAHPLNQVNSLPMEQVTGYTILQPRVWCPQRLTNRGRTPLCGAPGLISAGGIGHVPNCLAGFMWAKLSDVAAPERSLAGRMPKNPPVTTFLRPPWTCRAGHGYCHNRRLRACRAVPLHRWIRGDPAAPGFCAHAGAEGSHLPLFLSIDR
jgi:hypothetical protein